MRDTSWIDEYRRLFGDETVDYAEALKKHYANPPTDWPQSFISVYASSHSWEDWAETWAHYLHMVDGLETASEWGMNLHKAVSGEPALEGLPLDIESEDISHTIVEQWLPTTQFINAMDRSLGAHDSYPFIIAPAVVEKLNFVHKVVREARRGTVNMNFKVNEIEISSVESTKLQNFVKCSS